MARVRSMRLVAARTWTMLWLLLGTATATSALCTYGLAKTCPYCCGVAHSLGPGKTKRQQRGSYTRGAYVRNLSSAHNWQKRTLPGLPWEFATMYADFPPAVAAYRRECSSAAALRTWRDERRGHHSHAGGACNQPALPGRGACGSRFPAYGTIETGDFHARAAFAVLAWRPIADPETTDRDGTRFCQEGAAGSPWGGQISGPGHNQVPTNPTCYDYCPGTCRSDQGDLASCGAGLAACTGDRSYSRLPWNSTGSDLGHTCRACAHTDVAPLGRGWGLCHFAECWPAPGHCCTGGWLARSGPASSTRTACGHSGGTSGAPGPHLSCFAGTWSCHSIAGLPEITRWPQPLAHRRASSCTDTARLGCHSAWRSAAESHRQVAHTGAWPTLCGCVSAGDACYQVGGRTAPDWPLVCERKKGCMSTTLVKPACPPSVRSLLPSALLRTYAYSLVLAVLSSPVLPACPPPVRSFGPSAFVHACLCRHVPSAPRAAALRECASDKSSSFRNRLSPRRPRMRCAAVLDSSCFGGPLSKSLRVCLFDYLAIAFPVAVGYASHQKQLHQLQSLSTALAVACEGSASVEECHWLPRSVALPGTCLTQRLDAVTTVSTAPQQELLSCEQIWRGQLGCRGRLPASSGMTAKSAEIHLHCPWIAFMMRFTNATHMPKSEPVSWRKSGETGRSGLRPSDERACSGSELRTRRLTSLLCRARSAQGHLQLRMMADVSGLGCRALLASIAASPVLHHSSSSSSNAKSEECRVRCRPTTMATVITLQRRRAMHQQRAPLTAAHLKQLRQQQQHQCERHHRCPRLLRRRIHMCQRRCRRPVEWEALSWMRLVDLAWMMSSGMPEASPLTQWTRWRICSWPSQSSSGACSAFSLRSSHRCWTSCTRSFWHPSVHEQLSAASLPRHHAVLVSLAAAMERHSRLVSLAAGTSTCLGPSRQRPYLVSLAAGATWCLAMHARLTMPDGPCCEWNMAAVSHRILTADSHVHTICFSLAVPQRCMLHRSSGSHASAPVPRMLLGVLCAHGSHTSLNHYTSLVNAHQLLASVRHERPVIHASVTSGRLYVYLACPCAPPLGLSCFWPQLRGSIKALSLALKSPLTCPTHSSWTRWSKLWHSTLRRGLKLCAKQCGVFTCASRIYRAWKAMSTLSGMIGSHASMPNLCRWFVMQRQGRLGHREPQTDAQHLTSSAFQSPAASRVQAAHRLSHAAPSISDWDLPCPVSSLACYAALNTGSPVFWALRVPKESTVWLMQLYLACCLLTLQDIHLFRGFGFAFLVCSCPWPLRCHHHRGFVNMLPYQAFFLMHVLLCPTSPTCPCVSLSFGACGRPPEAVQKTLCSLLCLSSLCLLQLCLKLFPGPHPWPAVCRHLAEWPLRALRVGEASNPGPGSGTPSSGPPLPRSQSQPARALPSDSQTSSASGVQHPDAAPLPIKWASGRPSTLHCRWIPATQTWRWYAGSGERRLFAECRAGPTPALRQWLHQHADALAPTARSDIQSALDIRGIDCLASSAGPACSSGAPVPRTLPAQSDPLTPESSAH